MVFGDDYTVEGNSIITTHYTKILEVTFESIRDKLKSRNKVFLILAGCTCAADKETLLISYKAIGRVCQLCYTNVVCEYGMEKNIK